MTEERKYMGKILVVDDEPDIREILKRFLVEKGYEVSVASGGEEALERVEEENPDVVLLDIVMPGMTGIEVLKRIREMDKDIGVIMVTGVEDERIGNWTLTHGADDYITKPIDLGYVEMTVLMKIAMLMPEMSAAEELSPKAEVQRVVTLEGATPRAQVALGQAGIEITRFPFRVGRYSERGEDDVLSQNDLMLKDEVPYNVSRNHFTIDRIKGAICVVDRGSRLGTVVNGTRIGRGGGEQVAKLKEGQNEVIAGSQASPFRFIVTIKGSCRPL